MSTASVITGSAPANTFATVAAVPSAAWTREHARTAEVGVSAHPFISIIIPVFNDHDGLRRLLAALDQQDYPHECFECIVVDNGSLFCVQLDEGHAFTMRVFREPQPGSYAARNCGLREARGSILAFTDADCIPRPDWLSKAVEVIERQGNAVIVGGRVDVVPLGVAAPSAFVWHNMVNDLLQCRYVEAFHFAATANLIVPRPIIEEVGAFDASLYSSGDLEWGRRATACGRGLIYSDQVVVRHPARSNWKSVAAKSRRITGGHFALARRTGHPFWRTLKLIWRNANASVRRIWQDPRLPSRRVRACVALIDVGLRLVQVGELVRLAVGRTPRRQ